MTTFEPRIIVGGAVPGPGQRFPAQVLQDLESMGLSPADMAIRPLERAECAALGVPQGTTGYCIPYYEMYGRVRAFYRGKIFTGSRSRYAFRQPQDSLNHIYFPKAFFACVSQRKYVLITLEERSAVLATRKGIPSIAIGDIEGWKNKVLSLPADSQLSAKGPKLSVRVQSGTVGGSSVADGDTPDTGVTEEFNTALAVGFIEFVDLVIARGLHIVIVFDTDNHGEGDTGACTNVAQRAAATLGFELRFRGVPYNSIHQLILPKINDSDTAFTGATVSLGDYLHHEGTDAFLRLLKDNFAQRSTFPVHPNTRDYINRRLQTGKIGRKEMQNIALCVLSDLDTHGMRLRDTRGEAFYFDRRSLRLMPARWPSTQREQFDSVYARHLYTTYGISGADNKLIQWLSTLFGAEHPIDEVSPYRVLALPNQRAPGVSQSQSDKIYYQLSDAQFCEVSADNILIHSNGDAGVLFESDQVEPLDIDKLRHELRRQRQHIDTFGCDNWWGETLRQTRIHDQGKQRITASLLYYISPWLLRWRGTQLPIELIVAEAGSGKSTLMELRLEIISGRPLLRNTPATLRDWHASVVTAGGLHVVDNIQLSDRDLRQSLSDELCRICTELDPFIEQRKLFTNTDIVRMPVRAVFGFTSIVQPFLNADLIQRSFILELEKIRAERNPDVPDVIASSSPTMVPLEGSIRYDSSWKAVRLRERGGREAWVAHHLLVIQQFFRLVRTDWDVNYSAKARLVNYEQAMLLMAKLFRVDETSAIDTPVKEWLPNHLAQIVDKATTIADAVLEGLISFACEHYNDQTARQKFTVSVISDWAQTTDDYRTNEMLTNSRKLGRYMSAHKGLIFTLTGMTDAGLLNNRVCWKFTRRPTPLAQ